MTSALVICTLLLLGSLSPVATGSLDVFWLDDTYDRTQPPLPDDGSRLKVQLSLTLREVSSVNELTSEVTLFVYIKTYWVENRLRVNVSRFPANGEPLLLDHRRLQAFWLPDIYTLNLRNMRIVRFFGDIKSMKVYSNRQLRYLVACELTVICPMEFIMYPLDNHFCKISFASISNTKDVMELQWGKSLKFLPDWNRLAEFEAQVIAMQDEEIINDDMQVVSVAIILHRHLSRYILQTYIPGALFVIVSFISFIVNPEVVPGRMVLLVTNLLTLVTMFGTIRATTPPALSLKCVEVWIVGCIGFVFAALIQYAIVLASLRGGKKSAGTVPYLIKPFAKKPSVSAPVESPAEQTTTVEVKECFGPDIESRVLPAIPATGQQLTHRAASFPTLAPKESEPPPKRAPGDPPGWHYLDKFALMAFPIAFFIFNITYWSLYTDMRDREMEDYHKHL